MDTTPSGIDSKTNSGSSSKPIVSKTISAPTSTPIVLFRSTSPIVVTTLSRREIDESVLKITDGVGTLRYSV